MLPRSVNNLNLSRDAAGKLDYFFRRYCEDSDRKIIDLGHVVFACHAAFPLILSVELANLIWLNFKSFKFYGRTQIIDRLAVSDFLLSPLVRQVSFRQFEVIPEIRNYLLLLLKDPRWFQGYGITDLDGNRLLVLAHFLIAYLQSKKAQSENNSSGFREVNEWTALSYLSPDKLALKMAEALKSALDKEEEQAQLRINLLMDRFGKQIQLEGRQNDTNTRAFVNLYRFSKANRDRLFEKSSEEIAESMLQLDEEFIGISKLNNIVLEIPLAKQTQQLLKEKKKIQRVLSLFVDMEEDPNKFPNANYLELTWRKLNHLQNFDFSEIIILSKEQATYSGIFSSLDKICENINHDDVCFIYYNGPVQTSSDSVDYLRIFPDENQRDKITSIEFRRKIESLTATKKCQFVFFLDSRLDVVNWVDGQNILFGTTISSEVVRKEWDTESFTSELTRILLLTNGNITYRDLSIIINHAAIYPDKRLPSNQLSFHATSSNLNRFFLKTQTPKFDYLPVVYNTAYKFWEVLPRDFFNPVGLNLYLYSWKDNFLKRSIMNGETIKKNTGFETLGYMGAKIDNLDKKLMYKLAPRKPLFFKISESQLTAENIAKKELLNEKLISVNHNLFGIWNLLEDIETHHHNLSDFKCRGQYDLYWRSNSSSIQIFTTDWQEYVVEINHDSKIRKVSGSQDEIINFIQLFSNYYYLLTLETPYYLEPLQITSYDNSKDSIIIHDSDVVISGGNIDYKPLKTRLTNFEPFPIFVQEFLLCADFNIIKLNTELMKIEANQSKESCLDIAQFADTIAVDPQGVIHKILCNRDPIRLELF